MKKLGVQKIELRKLDVKTARIGLAVLLVVIGGVIGVVALLDGGSSEGSSQPTESPAVDNDAVALSLPELLAEVDKLGGPVFWAGTVPGTESYELSTTLDGRVYVRYLTGGAEAGDQRADFLTVGTYPVDDARKALKDATKSSESSLALSQQEGYEVLSSQGATNAYLVFDDQPDVQVEVFSPQPGEAAELATSGALEPLG